MISVSMPCELPRASLGVDRECRTAKADDTGAADQLDHLPGVQYLQVGQYRCGGFVFAIDVDDNAGIALSRRMRYRVVVDCRYAA